MYKIVCPHCHKEIAQFVEKLKIKSDGGFMIHGSCPSCTRYVKWVPFADSTIVKDALKFYSTLPEVKELIV